jgi:hypothetical protein
VNRTFLPVLVFALTPAISAQSARCQREAGRELKPQSMMEMHKQQMDAMKADIEKMKASLAAMKANLATITNTNELDRWRNNVDLWQTMLDHMVQMQKNMQSTGPGMMQGHAVGAAPPSPAEKKPE